MPGSQLRTFIVYVRVLATQVLYVTPLFWFMELGQNLTWKAVTGAYDYVWFYPRG